MTEVLKTREQLLHYRTKSWEDFRAYWIDMLLISPRCKKSRAEVEAIVDRVHAKATAKRIEHDAALRVRAEQRRQAAAKRQSEREMQRQLRREAASEMNRQ